MSLNDFLLALFDDGRVQVNYEIVPFADSDVEESSNTLCKEFQRRAIYLPFVTGFRPELAVACATFLYRSAQFCLIRHLGEEELQKSLVIPKQANSRDEIMSADLCLIYLRDVYNQAERMAPQDKLTEILLQAAQQYPFSSVGIEIGADNTSAVAQIFEDQVLLQEYADRIIQEQQQSRLRLKPVAEKVKELLGGHQELLWPSFTDD